jgi:hypothetical protein
MTSITGKKIGKFQPHEIGPSFGEASVGSSALSAPELSETISPPTEEEGVMLGRELFRDFAEYLKLGSLVTNDEALDQLFQHKTAYKQFVSRDGQDICDELTDTFEKAPPWRQYPLDLK